MYLTIWEDTLMRITVYSEVRRLNSRFPYTSMLGALLDHATKTPDKVFLIEKDKEYSYKRCVCIAYGYSQFLKTMGVKAGDCVVVKTTQSVATVMCDMALQMLHAIYVPLEKAIAADRANFIIGKTGANLFISDKELDVNAKYLNLKEIYNYEVAPEELPSVIEEPAADAIGEILFTTGTTGTSKGVSMSNNATVRTAENVAVAIGICEDDVEIVPVPINHAFGLRRMYANLLVGSSCIIMDGIVFIATLWKNIEKYHATGIALVPASLAVIFKLSGDRIADYQNQIRYIQIGSAVLPLADKQKLCALLPNTRLYDFYGCSEAGCVCTADYNLYKDKQKSLGKPACNANFRLICEDGSIVPYPTPNVTGLLSYGGSMNMTGYWKEPELTKEALVDGFINTKDLAYFDEDGFIFMLGRQDDVINCAGSKIAPTEIEEVAMMCPLVADCAVIGIPDAMAGEVPKMFVVPAEGTDFDEVAINNYILNKLEAYKAPRVIVSIDAIPRTYNGKILRRELKNM